MVKAALAFLLACLATANLTQLPDPIWYWLLAGLVPFCLYFHKPVLLLFISGLLWSGYQAQQQLNDRLSAQQQNQFHLISGRIASIPEQEAQRIRFLFIPDTTGVPPKILLSWYHTQQKPKAGERWQFQVKLKTPHGFRNPGGFDYERWLFLQGIGTTGYVSSSSQNKMIHTPVLTDIQHWRQITYDKLSTLLSGYSFKAFIIGLTIGDRHELTANHWRILQQTGTSHLMAISGLHIGLAAFFMFFIGRWLWSRSAYLLLLLPAQQAAAITAMTGALFYALLAGMSLPTQRALIMTATMLMGVVIKRQFFNKDLFALSLLVILIHDPFAVLSAGFWLSFGAVALIFLITLQRHPAPSRLWLTVPLFLALGLAPFTLLFFQQVSVISAVANSIAVPVVSLLIVPLVLTATVLMWCLPTVGQLLFQFADTLLGYLWYVLDALSHMPMAHWQAANIPDVTLLSALVGILLLTLPRGIPARWLGIIFLLPALLFQQPRPAAGNFELVVLDVGQGLSAVVETANHVLVFDTGRYFSEHFNIGSAVLIPYIQYKGIHQLDTLIVSHHDIDHSGGTADLINTIPITTRLTSDTDFLADSTACEQGQNWQWDGVQFEILNPTHQQMESDNNRSCVLKITGAQFSALLAADIEHESEQRLVTTDAEKLHADILVVPHHGSRSSSSQIFVDAVSPGYASFSLGYHNPYQFPASAVVSRYSKLGSEILRTDRGGAQIYRWHPRKGLEVTQWREADQHLWSSITTE